MMDVGKTIVGKSRRLLDNEMPIQFNLENCFRFQGQEEDAEMWGGAVAFKYRVEDARLGRFFSVDPISHKFPYNSSYAFSENRTIAFIEFEGLESVFIAFEGGIWGKGDRAEVGTTADIVNDVVSSSNEKMSVAGIAIKTGTKEESLETAMNFLQENYSKKDGGKIAIYGYSAGGVRALELARELNSKGYAVEILVVVDAAMGPATNRIDRSVPMNVKEVYNFFQGDHSLIGSHGNEIVNLDPAGWYNQGFFQFAMSYEVENISHGSIDEVVRPVATSFIQKGFELDYNQEAQWDESAGAKESNGRRSVGSSMEKSSSSP